MIDNRIENSSKIFWAIFIAILFLPYMKSWQHEVQSLKGRGLLIKDGYDPTSLTVEVRPALLFFDREKYMSLYEGSIPENKEENKMMIILGIIAIIGGIFGFCKILDLAAADTEVNSDENTITINWRENFCAQDGTHD